MMTLPERGWKIRETAKKRVTFQHDGAPSRARVQLRYGCARILWFMVDITIVYSIHRVYKPTNIQFYGLW